MKVWRGRQPPDSLAPMVKKACRACKVPRIMDEDDVVQRTTEWLRGVEIDRVLANWGASSSSRPRSASAGACRA
ncbi:MAG: hypothetical protein U0353_26790 [Sandaracinus sp.]